MASKDEKQPYDLLAGGTDVTPEGEFSLEEILAEYGGGRQKLLRDVEQAAGGEPAVSAEPEKPAERPSRVDPGEPEGPVTPEPVRTPDQPEALAELLERELPKAPHPVSLEEVVGSTVDAVMEEAQTAGPLLKPRRGLFSRRRLEETEELYGPPEPEPEPEEEPIGPEPDLLDAAEACRRTFRRRQASVPAAFLLALMPAAVLVAEAAGVEIPGWTGQLRLQAAVLLGCLAATALAARHVFVKAAETLGRRRLTGHALAALSAVVSAGDCAAALWLPERTAVPPYAAVSCMALAFALWGDMRERRGDYDMLRTAAVDDEPPYLVTEMEKGACKQRGAVPGFYTTARKGDVSSLWQTVFLPLILVASVVFAGLSSLGQGRRADFLLNWSAILAAGATFSLPLCWSLPWSRLARHLQKAGCAVAGWCGAERISHRRSMVVSDGDLFPPGTIQLNGVKVFGEELPRAVSYAATLARCAGCGLERLFDGLLRSEGGRYEKAEDFSFYQEGGYSAAIHGETVLLGTASFMRKMEVRLPSGINLKTGVFLAVDRQLTAVFAVKYNAAENVDFALRIMRRSHVTPILAARDPNVTPALLKRKFHKKVRVEYPSLSARVALSEAELDRGLPRALLFREGLLPYAETVVGSRRMCGAVRRGTGLSLLGSAAGTLLTYYLVSQSAYGLLTPLGLLVFLLLWTLPVLVMSDWVGRY